MRKRKACSSPSCMTRLRAGWVTQPPSGFQAAGDVLDPPGRERDEEKDIDSLQKNGLDREKVAREHARRLRSQEGSPREMRASWRRPETRLEQHLAHRRRRNRKPETLELADGPFVSPVRVLPREPKDQLAERALERWPSRLPVRVRPPSGDQLAVPAKQRLRPEREGRPGCPRERAAQRRQQCSISPRQRRPRGLTAEDRQLVAKDEDLQLLRATPPP
jgi:hypothetical protein